MIIESLLGEDDNQPLLSEGEGQKLANNLQTRPDETQADETQREKPGEFSIAESAKRITSDLDTPDFSHLYEGRVTRKKIGVSYDSDVASEMSARRSRGGEVLRGERGREGQGWLLELSSAASRSMVYAGTGLANTVEKIADIAGAEYAERFANSLRLEAETFYGSKKGGFMGNAEDATAAEWLASLVGEQTVILTAMAASGFASVGLSSALKLGTKAALATGFVGSTTTLSMLTAGDNVDAIMRAADGRISEEAGFAMGFSSALIQGALESVISPGAIFGKYAAINAMKAASRPLAEIAVASGGRTFFSGARKYFGAIGVEGFTEFSQSVTQSLWEDAAEGPGITMGKTEFKQAMTEALYAIPTAAIFGGFAAFAEHQVKSGIITRQRSLESNKEAVLSKFTEADREAVAEATEAKFDELTESLVVKFGRRGASAISSLFKEVAYQYAALDGGFSPEAYIEGFNVVLSNTKLTAKQIDEIGKITDPGEKIQWARNNVQGYRTFENDEKDNHQTRGNEEQFNSELQSNRKTLGADFGVELESEVESDLQDNQEKTIEDGKEKKGTSPAEDAEDAQLRNAKSAERLFKLRQLAAEKVAELGLQKTRAGQRILRVNSATMLESMLDPDGDSSWITPTSMRQSLIGLMRLQDTRVSSEELAIRADETTDANLLDTFMVYALLSEKNYEAFNSGEIRDALKRLSGSPSAWTAIVESGDSDFLSVLNANTEFLALSDEQAVELSEAEADAIIEEGEAAETAAELEADARIQFEREFSIELGIAFDPSNPKSMSAAIDKLLAAVNSQITDASNESAVVAQKLGELRALEEGQLEIDADERVYLEMNRKARNLIATQNFLTALQTEQDVAVDEINTDALDAIVDGERSRIDEERAQNARLHRELRKMPDRMLESGTAQSSDVDPAGRISVGDFVKIEGAVSFVKKIKVIGGRVFAVVSHGGSSNASGSVELLSNSSIESMSTDEISEFKKGQSERDRQTEGDRRGAKERVYIDGEGHPIPSSVKIRNDGNIYVIPVGTNGAHAVVLGDKIIETFKSKQEADAALESSAGREVFAHYDVDTGRAIFYKNATAEDVIHEWFHHLDMNNLLPAGMQAEMNTQYGIGQGSTIDQINAAREKAARDFVIYIKAKAEGETEIAYPKGMEETFEYLRAVFVEPIHATSGTVEVGEQNESSLARSALAAMMLLSPVQTGNVQTKQAIELSEKAGVSPVLAENSGKNFVKRIFEKNPKFINNEDGSISTHLMATEVTESGEWIVFPTVIQREAGAELEKLELRDAQKYATDSGEYISFGADKESALKFGENGYKAGTPMDESVQDSGGMLESSTAVPENESVVFVGRQEGTGGLPAFNLWNLKVDIEGHPATSTVSDKILTDSGIEIPKIAEPSVRNLESSTTFEYKPEVQDFFKGLLDGVTAEEKHAVIGKILSGEIQTALPWGETSQIVLDSKNSKPAAEMTDPVKILHRANSNGHDSFNSYVKAVLGDEAYAAWDRKWASLSIEQQREAAVLAEEEAPATVDGDVVAVSKDGSMRYLPGALENQAQVEFQMSWKQLNEKGLDPKTMLENERKRKSVQQGLDRAHRAAEKKRLATTKKKLSGEEGRRENLSTIDEYAKETETIPESIKSELTERNGEAVRWKNKILGIVKKRLDRSYASSVAHTTGINKLLEYIGHGNPDNPLVRIIGDTLHKIGNDVANAGFESQKWLTDYEKEFGASISDKEWNKTRMYGSDNTQLTMKQAMWIYLYTDKGRNKAAKKALIGSNEFDLGKNADSVITGIIKTLDGQVQYVKAKPTGGFIYSDTDKGAGFVKTYPAKNFAKMHMKMMKTYHPILDKVHNRITGGPLGNLGATTYHVDKNGVKVAYTPEYYAPSQRRGAVVRTGFNPQEEGVSPKKDTGKRSGDFNATKSRQRGVVGAEFVMDARAILANYRSEADIYRTKAEELTRLDALVADPSFKKSLRRLVGHVESDPIHKALTTMLHRERFINGKIHADTEADRILGTLKSHAIFAGLGGRIRSQVLQTASGTRTFGEIPVQDWGRYVVNYKDAIAHVAGDTRRMAGIFTSPHKVFEGEGPAADAVRMIMKHNPYIWTRRADPDLQSRRHGKVQALFMGGFTVADMGTVIAVYKTVYDSRTRVLTERSLNGGKQMSAEQIEIAANKEAARVVDETQPASTTRQRTLLQTNRESVKILYPFTGDLMVQLQYNVHNIVHPLIRAAKRDGWSGAWNVLVYGEYGRSPVGQRIIMGSLMPMALVSLIRRGRLPEDEEEFATDIMASLVSTFPAVGPIFASMFNDGYVSAENFVLGSFASIAKGGVAAKEGDKMRAIINFARGFSSLGGVPHSLIPLYKELCATIINDPNTSADDRTTAEKALELMSLSISERNPDRSWFDGVENVSERK